MESENLAPSLHISPIGAQSYISQWGNGFAFHSSEFVKGYINGFFSIPANKNVGSDGDTAAWDCTIGPTFAKWFIGKRKPTTEGIVVCFTG